MLILPALATLFTYLYWRPHQISDAFQWLTINTSLAFVTFCYLLDLRGGASRPKWSPLLALLAGFTIWCLITTVIKAPERVGEQVAKMATAFLTFYFISQGVQTVRGVRIAGQVLLLFTLALATLGVDQGLAPTGCYLTEAPLSDNVALGFDGRSCASRAQCNEGGDPNLEFLCEHQGWLDTASVGGRVRYRGILDDPNELAWALAMGIPLVFAFYEAKPTRRRLLFAVLAFATTATCVIFTQSRSGQLSLLATVTVYFIRRYRWRGLVAVLLAGLPVFLLGGRSDANADSSTEQRLGCWSEAVAMFRENPIIGVGNGQFVEHHFQTAHNSFLLALAETGPVGFVLWLGGVYFAIKLTVRIQTELRDHEEATAARSLAMALLASMVGLVVSAVFLSLTYHPILWIFLGMTGALYAAVRKHAPDFRVGFGLRDLMLVSALGTGFVGFIAVYLKIKGI
jgi:O-antigen ligase